MTDVPNPKLYEPPADSSAPWEAKLGIGVYRFPLWFVVQEEDGEGRERSRRLVPRKALDDKGRFEGQQVVPTRFVRACPRGHVDDLDWRVFVHGPDDPCKRQLWLDERGTGGDLGDLSVRCACGQQRGMHEAADPDLDALGTLLRQASMARCACQRALWAAEQTAHPDGYELVLPSGGQRVVAAGAWKRG